ncbi:MAG: HAD family hydrolase [Kiritimatiellia bacterium]|nr:HAD family hydrolase [Kiritimatiellia bacterium]
MTKITKRKCVFFDRDGIVNESPGQGRYLTRWQDFHLIPEFITCLRSVLKMGYQAVIVTNQRAVARGLISIKDLEHIHRRLKRLLMRQYGLKLLDIIYCPHNANECSCRKPSPGMLLDMAAKHNLDLTASWMIGDSGTDVEAGRRAGCRTILVAGSPRRLRRRAGNSSGLKADKRIPSMRVLAKRIHAIISV